MPERNPQVEPPLVQDVPPSVVQRVAPIVESLVAKHPVAALAAALAAGMYLGWLIKRR